MEWTTVTRPARFTPAPRHAGFPPSLRAPIPHPSARLSTGLALAGLIALVACNNDGGGIQSSNTEPVIELLSPQEGSGYDDGEEIIARGTISDREEIASRLSITLIVDNGDPIEVENDGSGSWRYLLPDLDVGSYVLEAQVRDNDGGVGADSVTFVVDPVNQKPTAQITSHVGGEEIPENTAITFRGVVTDDGSLGDLDVQWSSDLVATPLGDSTADLSGNVQLTVPGLSPGVHRIRLVASDGSLTSDPASVDIVVVDVNEPPADPDIDLLPTQPTTEDTLTLKLNNEGEDPDGDVLTYAINWYRDDVLMPELRGKRTVTPDRTSRGQTWQVRVQAEDAPGTLSAIQTAEVTVVNSRPSLSGATLTPANPFTNSTLTVLASGASDPDGDGVTYRYAWSVNGATVLDYDANTLSGDHFRKGDEVICQVTPTDGATTGVTVTTPAVTIGDAPATGLDVSITPQAPVLSDALHCNITQNAIDLDGDMITYRYTWLRDGQTVYENEAGRSTIEARQTGLGQTWTCVVTPLSAGLSGETASDQVTVRAGEGSVIVTEIMAHPSTYPTAGEYVELHNVASVAVDVSGWVLRDASGDNFVISPGESLMVNAGSYLVIGASGDTAANGGVEVNVVWAGFRLDDSADEVVIEADGDVVDRVIYGNAVGIPVPVGAALNLDLSAYDATLNDGPEGWCRATTPLSGAGFGTPGRINDLCACAESDGDGDGYGSDTTTCAVLDCDDSDGSISPGAAEICEDGVDNDCVGGDPVCDCAGSDDDGDGYGDALGCPAAERDCDDANPAINPGAVEICDDLIDNDCAGGDKICPCGETDDDGDGFGDGPGCPLAQLDCNDSDSDTYPGAPELCDDRDNDCDGTADDGLDQDMDGFRICPVIADEDCDDRDATAYPGATEICDAKDNDCDSRADEGFDGDGDGITTCAGDCNDADDGVYPGATEICGNGKDDNCSGQDAECGCAATDGDGDGYGTSNLCGVKDCNDADVGIYPGAPETCAKADDDCDGLIDEGLDKDGDGVRTCDADPDCNDLDADINPNATEQCVPVIEADDDCDGVVDEGFDRDSDGFTTCGPLADQDCADLNPQVNPAAMEVCDDDDNDCDGEIDESSAADAYEPNDTKDAFYPGGFVVLSRQLNLTIDEPGDVDWFTFQTSDVGLSGSYLRIDTTDIGVEAEMCNKRFPDICVDVSAGPYSTDTEYFPSAPIPQGGDWYLEVKGRSSLSFSCEPFVVLVVLK